MPYPQSITRQSTITVTAGYPYYPGGSEHGGIDYVTNDNLFYSPVAGRVVWAQVWNGETTGNQSWGNMILIQFGTNQYCLLAHFAEQLWSEGAQIGKGQFVGVQGQSGNVTGTHTHVEYWSGGQSTAYRVDPSIITGIPNDTSRPFPQIYEVTWDAAPISAKWHAKDTGGYARDSQEAYENAIMAYTALSNLGWTLNAFCGYWGNVGYESVYNPWRWESDQVLSITDTDLIANSDVHGYGLAGITPSGRYINSSVAKSYSGYMPNFSDRPGNPNDGNAQVLFTNYEGYYTTTEYPLPFSEYKKSTEHVATLASIWMHNYERPASYVTEPDRQKEAEYWYQILSGYSPGPTPQKRRGMPLWMYLYPWF